MIELAGKYNRNCKVFNDDVENEALSTIYSILDTKEHKDSPIRIMPDVHDGKGIVIGFTQPLTDSVCPSHVGVDIGCCVDLYITDTKINPEDYPIIEHRIKKEIPFGMQLCKKQPYEDKELFKFLRNYHTKARASWPEMVEDIYIDVDYIRSVCNRIGITESVWYNSFNTVGSGNHYIEVNDYNGNYAFSIHCGSRNFGKKICEYWENVANGEVFDKKKLKEIVEELKKNEPDKTKYPELVEQAKQSLIDKSSTKGYLTGENMKGYITDMVLATAYSLFNHKCIADKMEQIFKKVCGAKVIEKITSIHNYIDFDDHIIRKGAIRAYEDEKILVPLNMRDGIAICRGLGNPDWNFSCSHGAGRKMSRSKAKETLSLEDFQNDMKDVYSTSVAQSTIDESPAAYKDSGTILELIKETCEVLTVVKPIINVKDSSTVPAWMNRNNRNKEREQKQNNK